MSQIQNFEVNYSINVEATQGVRQVENFAAAISKLVEGKKNLEPAVKNINSLMRSVDRMFKTQKGRKKDFSYKMDVDIVKAETKLTTIKTLLTDIQNQSKTKVRINVAPVKPADIKKDLGLTKKKDTPLTAKVTTPNITEKQKSITKAIGKINAGLTHLQKGRKINIDTKASKKKLQDMIVLLGKIKSATSKKMSLSVNMPYMMLPGNPVITPYALNRQFPISDKTQAKVQEKLWKNQQLYHQKQSFREQDAVEKKRRILEQNTLRRKEREDRQRIKKEKDQQQRNAADIIRSNQRSIQQQQSVYNSKQKGAINRLQYAKAPSFSNMPFAHMFNAYMGYSLMRREVTEAVEYSNIMQSAHSILRVADNDLSTFQTRFDEMARYVRQIGIETKFTAIEVAGAVKYLAMAGMGVETINNSIRPITNLALIGDNDLSQIADLATNIMAGYNIESGSMNSVADIIASTISRSNVNIIEMAESYKMAAGYMNLAGVDFSESAAAIGILSNTGIKGTMAGTSLRGMATRFAKPTKQAKQVLDRLNIKFTENQDIYGEKVEKLRPLADIFQDLYTQGATLEDAITIFGKTAGSGAMMLLENHEKLRELTTQNRVSHGISSELAKVKQETTKGLWYQMTSMFSESFMQAYELLEPQIRSVLKSFVGKFNGRELARGLASIGNVLLDLLTALGNIATWVTKNFHWIEPLLFTGVVGTRLFKLAGAITNLGVAFGFLGKQAAASTALQSITGLAGFGGMGGLRGLSLTDKRSLVTALRASGVTGKGTMVAALSRTGGASLLSRVGQAGMFASQVATGNGLIGAGASISALGGAAVAATAGFAALAGAIGWVAYKTWKVKEAKDAVQEEINSNQKYRYPSINSLYESLEKAYLMAKATKKEVDGLTQEKTIEESSGQKIGAFTGNWWAAALGSMGGSPHYGGSYRTNTYSFGSARQDDTVAALETIAKRESQSRINSAYAELGKFKHAYQVAAFRSNIQTKYGQSEDTLDKSLWKTVNGKIVYNSGIGDMKESMAAKTWHYANYLNKETVKFIDVAAEGYRQAIESTSSAMDVAQRAGLNIDALKTKGFYQDKAGIWQQTIKGKGSTQDDKMQELANRMEIETNLKHVAVALRNSFGGSAEIAENILEKAGFTKNLFANEPHSAKENPWDANGITSNKGPDDNASGGNYSGTGKLSSAAPKQVIVNISNLLSIDTIDLMKSKEGQDTEVQSLKEQLAQALIDVVHDFDASWNG